MVRLPSDRHPPIAPLAKGTNHRLSLPVARPFSRLPSSAAARAHVASPTTTRWRRLRRLRPLLRWSPSTHIQRHFLIGRSGMLLHWFGSRRLKHPRFLVVMRPPKSTGQRRHQSSWPRPCHLGRSLGNQLERRDPTSPLERPLQPPRRALYIFLCHSWYCGPIMPIMQQSVVCTESLSETCAKQK